MIIFQLLTVKSTFYFVLFIQIDTFPQKYFMDPTSSTSGVRKNIGNPFSWLFSFVHKSESISVEIPESGNIENYLIALSQNLFAAYWHHIHSSFSGSRLVNLVHQPCHAFTGSRNVCTLRSATNAEKNTEIEISTLINHAVIAGDYYGIIVQKDEEVLLVLGGAITHPAILNNRRYIESKSNTHINFDIGNISDFIFSHLSIQFLISTSITTRPIALCGLSNLQNTILIYRLSHSTESESKLMSSSYDSTQLSILFGSNRIVSGLVTPAGTNGSAAVIDILRKTFESNMESHKHVRLIVAGSRRSFDELANYLNRGERSEAVRFLIYETNAISPVGGFKSSSRVSSSTASPTCSIASSSSPLKEIAMASSTSRIHAALTRLTDLREHISKRALLMLQHRSGAYDSVSSRGHRTGRALWALCFKLYLPRQKR